MPRSKRRTCLLVCVCARARQCAYRSLTRATCGLLQMLQMCAAEWGQVVADGAETAGNYQSKSDAVPRPKY